MPTNRILPLLAERLAALAAGGRLKGRETVIAGIVPPRDGLGPRYLIEGEGERPFLRMNANNYLGLAGRADIIAAEERAARRYGAGPGAVRFVSGTWAPHAQLERRLAAFHERPAAMLFSSAYASVLGALPALIDERTAVISDRLNHNCIINAIALARPARKLIYDHLDLDQLRDHLGAASKTCARAIVVTDGVFSMRGDHAPLAAIRELVEAHDPAFAENAILVVDDSHGVGALGDNGRGTEEITRTRAADVLIGTLGKAFGVNGGYVVADADLIGYLRETAALYIYSNPITPSEAAAALAAIELVDGTTGRALLTHLRDVTRRFRAGLQSIGLETIAGEHPIVPLMIRDTERTARTVAYLRREGVLATGINYPVVPKGDEAIRFQLSADHTHEDVDEALAVLRRLPG